jgi:alkanesulfonate monooxygenase SsuD/methylene tetrahydromethanopterin reductase-like flavin-dependent oxidoreductase (luciferase family)
MREGLEIILKAWSGKPFTYEGRFYKYKDLEVWPRPEQRPHPPIWISCSQTPSSFEWAGRMGYSILTVAYRSVEVLVVNNKVYREAYRKAGHKQEGCRIAAHYQAVLSEDGREAKQIARAAVERYTAATTHTLERLEQDRAYEQDPERDRMKQDLLDIDRMVDECRIIAGTPDEAVRLLERAQDLMGFTQCDCTFYWGGIPYAAAQRSQRLFGEKVMPRLKAREPGN